MSIVLTDEQEKVEREVLPQQVPPLDIRVQALEQALKYTMENIKVRITLPSPLVGVPPVTQETNLYQLYLAQLAQARAAHEAQAARDSQGVTDGNGHVEAGNATGQPAAA